MEYLKSVEKAISETQLLEMEKQINLPFPKDYKNFLLRVNVGVPKEKYLSFFIEEIKEEIFLGVLLGLSENKNFSLIDWNVEYQSELPEHSFVFATEYSGGLFVMIIEGENKGVYFWDHTFIFEHSSEDSNVYFLSENFTDFIESIASANL